HLLYYKWFTLRFVQKAKTIATVSNFSKTDILIKYKIAPQKVSVVYSAAKDVFKPIDYEAQQVIKDKFTGGREYLIYVGAIQPRKNLLNLLKAYSLFKKRLKTEMKLVFAGRMAWKNDQLLELLNTYKHKDDVVLTGYLDENELSALVASAYGLVYPSVFEGFGVPVLEAMQCHVPVLTSENTSMQEIAEDAALYFDPNNISDIADKLMIIYKDEDLRKKLIEKGKLISKKYSWQNTADLLWDCMQKAIDGKEKI
ncbi:MAG TPA: glycosyltransferase family 1 protein, partial [Flavisolibacter sp.]|nr:glycosyltransferase family 1 protein [Flavisolibacter sp.]